MEAETSGDVKPYVCSNCYEIFDSEEMLTNHTCNEIKPVVCSVCYLVFKDDKDLADHKSSEHNGEGGEDMITDPDADILSRMECDNDVKPLVCHLCSDVFSSLETLNEHTLTHVEAKPMACGVCNLVFRLLDAYTEHLKIHEHEAQALQDQQQQQLNELRKKPKTPPSRSHLCTQCNKSFVSRYNLDRHIKSHTDNEKYHTCTICQKTFNQKNSLKYHMESHRVYTCGTCKRTFVLKSDLNVHMLVHSEHGSYLCGKCNTAFSEKLKLESHLLINHGIVVKSIVLEKRKAGPQEDLSSAPSSADVQKAGNQKSRTEFSEDKSKGDSRSKAQSFQCLHCPKKFSDAGSLATHKLMHPEVKLHKVKCKMCDKRFLDQASVKLHLTTDHKAKPNVQPKRCQQCFRGCSSCLKYKEDVQYHTCQQCNKTFKDESSLAAHKQLHKNTNSLQCELCNEVFPGHYELYFHTLKHPKKCEKCDHTFRRETELRNHILAVHNNMEITVKTLPECVQCRKIFSTKYKYDEHMATMHNSDKSSEGNTNFNQKFSSDEHGLVSETDLSEDKKSQQGSKWRKAAQSYDCEICGRSCHSATSLKLHTRKIHENAATLNHKCSMCQMTFQSKVEHDKHVLKHNIDKVYQESAGEKEDLDMSQDHDVKPLICEDCNAHQRHQTHPLFAEKFQSSNNPETSNIANSYQCKQCNKCFLSPMELNEHIKWHKAVQSYDCEICGRSCHSATSLKLHIRKIHENLATSESQVDRKKTESDAQMEMDKTGTGDFHQCKLCDAKFIQEKWLKRHVSALHRGPEHQCLICHKTFRKKRKAVVKQQWEHTNARPYKCEHCNVTFARKSSLEQHLPIHNLKKPHQCAKCSESFTTKEELEEHVEVHIISRQYVCEVCASPFASKHSLANHMRLHTGKNLVHCPHCGKIFTRKSELTKHMVVHVDRKQ